MMCEPTFFDIEYEINPWMHKDNQVDPVIAKDQWNKLRSIYQDSFGWEVKLVEPVEGLPDMVFTANGGLVIDKKVVLPTFREPDRQPETAKFRKWFESNGYTEFLEPKYDFEGEGDALVWNEIIFAGYPWRSDYPSHKELAKFFNRRIVSLQIVDARYYHLDTCLTIVDDQTVSIWPGAFSQDSIRMIHDIVPNVIEATDEDAQVYGLNAMSDGNKIVLSDRATNLINKYKEMNLEVIGTPIGEYQKSGGGVKCLTLVLRD